MPQFGGAPYFQGAIKSDTTLLSQPTSLASNLGRTKGSSRASGKSSTNKDPKGLPGETSAYIMEDIRLDNEMRNVKLDMNKFMVEGGGFNANTYAAAQKKFGPKLSQLMTDQRMLRATGPLIEENLETGNNTLEAIGQLSKNEYAADAKGEFKLMPDGKGGSRRATIGDIRQEIVGTVGMVDQEALNYRHPDFDETLDAIRDELHTGTGSTLLALNVNDRLELLKFAATGKNIEDYPAMMTKLQKAATKTSTDARQLAIAVGNVNRLINTDSEHSRALNYGFNLEYESMKRLSEIDTKGIKNKNTIERIEDAILYMGKEKGDLRMEYFDDVITEKKSQLTDLSEVTDVSFMDDILIRGTDKIEGQDSYQKGFFDIEGYGRKVTQFALVAGTTIKGQAWKDLFEGDAPYAMVNDNVSTFFEKGTLSGDLALDSKYVEMANNAKFQYDDLLSKSMFKVAEGVKNSFITASLKYKDPEAYQTMNMLGALLEPGQKLSDIDFLKDANETQRKDFFDKMKEKKREEGTGFVDTFQGLDVFLDSFKDFGNLLPESMRKKIDYFATAEEEDPLVKVGNTIFDPKLVLTIDATYEEEDYTPYQAKQLLISKKGVYNRELGDKMYFHGVEIDAAGLKIYKANSRFEGFVPKDIAYNNFKYPEDKQIEARYNAEKNKMRQNLGVIFDEDEIVNFIGPNIDKLGFKTLEYGKKGYEEGPTDSEINVTDKIQKTFGSKMSFKKFKEFYEIEELKGSEIKDAVKRSMNGMDYDVKEYNRLDDETVYYIVNGIFNYGEKAKEDDYEVYVKPKTSNMDADKKRISESEESQSQRDAYTDVEEKNTTSK
jgi:hypothetical protein